MIYSMTAFARSQQQSDSGHFTCEIRSINHRYLDISMHLPEALRSLEMPLREQIRDVLKRGKVECTLRYQSHADASNEMVRINTHYATSLCQAAESIAGLLKHPALISATDILRFPGVLESKELDLGQMEEVIKKLVSHTLSELLNARAREGEGLKNLCLQRMDAIGVELQKILARYPVVMAEQKDKLRKRFQDALIELDPQRLEQEMVYYSQKMDVAEEIDRAHTHLAELRRIFTDGGLAGRRLDFLIQELHREANTLGSKSADAELMHAAVEMKVLIEQIREQVQNIE